MLWTSTLSMLFPESPQQLYLSGFAKSKMIGHPIQHGSGGSAACAVQHGGRHLEHHDTPCLVSTPLVDDD